MDSLTQMIVDFLRRGKDPEALNQGGLTAGTPDAALLMKRSSADPMAPAGRGPRAIEPKHEGRTYDEIVTKFEQG